MKAKPRSKSPRKSKKAAAASGAADDCAFLSLLIHELRTPLTALRGSLGLLTGAVEDAAAEVQNFAGIADRNAGKLAGMLDEAAEYARINDPATPLNRELTDIADTVHRAIEQVQALADERGSVLNAESVPAEATIDPALVRIAIVRLLSYALRVSPKASTIRIRIGTVDDAHVEISVSDCGKVIGADKIAGMFEPFGSVARRGAEPAMKSGLGLAIAHNVAQAHGGSLEFAPTTTGGLFSLRLPV